MKTAIKTNQPAKKLNVKDVEWKQISVPMQAFSMDAHEVNVGTNGEGTKSGPLRLVALSGDPFEGYFGQTIQDLEGMTHGKRIAVDYGHDDKEVIGYINKFSTEDGQLVLEGALTPFGDNDRAAEIIHKSAQGVPYQASIFFAPAVPGDTQIEELPSGNTAQVNGREIHGPATIFRKWVLRGVAITPYGMDAGTAAFLQKQGNQEVEIDMKKAKEGHKQGAKLAAALDKAIAAKVTDDTDREAIITSIASTVGIDAAAVNQILDGTIDCPELEQLQGFAKWLEVSEDALVSAAVEDGCKFSEHEDDDEGDEEDDQSSKQKKASGKGSGSDQNGDFKKFRQFIKLFGPKKGEEYFDQELDIEMAQTKYIQALEAKNKKLVEAGPDAAEFDSDDGNEATETRFTQKQVDAYCKATGSTNAEGIMQAEEKRAEKSASK